MPGFISLTVRLLAKTFKSPVMKAPVPAASRTISKNTRCGSRTSVAHCIRLKQFSGSIRRLRKLLRLTNFGGRQTPWPTVFTSSAEARTHAWRSRSMAQVEWTMSFLAKRCHSIVSQPDCSSRRLAGTLCGDADISLAPNDPRYRASLSVGEINFPRLTELYFKYKTAQGLLRGTYEFNGLGSDWRTMRGSGKVEVSNGDVFAIPIFGPLSGILNHIVPGSGYSIAHKANAKFTVEN